MSLRRPAFNIADRAGGAFGNTIGYLQPTAKGGGTDVGAPIRENLVFGTTTSSGGTGGGGTTLVSATWDANAKAPSIVLSADQLTASDSSFNPDSVRATVGAQIGATQDISFIATVNSRGSAVYIGLATAAMSLTTQPDPKMPTSGAGETNIAVMQDGAIYKSDFTMLGSPGKWGAGDQYWVRLKNGFLYICARAAGGGAWGPWNGSSGLYANATPDTANNGIPIVAPFGGDSTLMVYPYAYMAIDSVTADFSNWAKQSVATSVRAHRSSMVLGLPVG